MMNCPSNNARKLLHNADLSKDPAEKYTLYMEASKEYLKASNSIEDVVTHASLRYLSSNAIYKANLVQKFAHQKSKANMNQLDQIDRNMGKLKVSGPTSEISEALHLQRIIYKSHQNRISSISKIPKAMESSPSCVVRDLLLLESKLNELGMEKDDEYHDTLLTAHHSALLNTPSSSSSLGRSSVHLSSDLGESFMLLKPSTTVSTEDFHRQSRIDHNLQGNITGGRTEAHAGLNKQRVPYRNGSDRLQAASDGTWTNTVMTWGGFGVVGTSPVPPSSTERESEDPHAAPSWNEQSVFVSSLSTNQSGDQLSQSTISADGGDMSNSNISAINSEGQRNAQGVTNLLKTVQRLSDENAQLVARIERIKGEKDAQMRQVRNDVITFKQDYNNKFSRVKSALRDYSAAHQHEDNPVLQGTLDATSDMLRETEERLMRAREALTLTEKQSRKDSLNKGNATAVHVTKSDLDSTVVVGDGEKRQRELERTVQALVGRLQKANDDNKRKDILLKTLDPSYVSSSAEGTSAKPSSHSSSRTSSASNKTSNLAPPLQHPSSQSQQGAYISSGSGGGKGIAMPSSGSVASQSTRVSSGASSKGSPTPKKSSASISKHPSTATLEALQKANK